MRAIVLMLFGLTMTPLLAQAQSFTAGSFTASFRSDATGVVADPWRAAWSPSTRQAPAIRWSDLSLPAAGSLVRQGAGQPLHAAAIEHSDAYQTRARIHKLASFATLPLFATELALGQSLYHTPDRGAKRAAHGVVGAGIVSLFAVNSVTGAWNLFGHEGRQETEGRRLRLVHGLLMLAADAGFAATAMTGPNSESERQRFTYESNKTTHRNLALVSIGTGTIGYLSMLFGNH
jgi:hypothetical protein